MSSSSSNSEGSYMSVSEHSTALADPLAWSTVSFATKIMWVNSRRRVRREVRIQFWHQGRRRTIRVEGLRLHRAKQYLITILSLSERASDPEVKAAIAMVEAWVPPCPLLDVEDEEDTETARDTEGEED